mgnify:FL=1|tara:strand:- start:28 stop:756 length:729 start_codon:yes stop_codon:yes gene_type:complete
MDCKKRTLIKSLSWKIAGSLSLVLLTYLTTGSLKVAGIVAVLQFIITFFLYFVHERVWNYITWGKTTGLSIQLTGMSGSGKSTLSKIVSQSLRKKGYKVEIIDGDEYRENLCKDLGFSKEDRNTNIRRLSFVSKVLSRNNVISIIAAINPYEDIREENRKKDPNLKTVFIKCDLNTLIKRDVKGLYARAMLPDEDPEKIKNFTGISDPFEEPSRPDLIINTAEQSIDKSVKILEKFIIKSIS